MTDTPGGGTSTPPDPDFLQVYMAHDITIAAFKRWVTSQGWELKPIPAFGAADDPDYIPTHMIVPANLDQLMAQRRAEHLAQYRKENGLD